MKTLRLTLISLILLISAQLCIADQQIPVDCGAKYETGDQACNDAYQGCLNRGGSRECCQTMVELCDRCVKSKWYECLKTGFWPELPACTSGMSCCLKQIQCTEGAKY
ncbi:hypothetical protein JNK13_07175 [bacterium]|nr:hypothetical protein [bacterium]